MKHHYYAFIILIFGLFSNIAFAQNPLMNIAHNGATLEGEPYEFRIGLFTAATTPVTVDVITIANTADASDYTPFSTTVTIPAGELLSEVLYIPTTNDAVIETNEKFTISATVTSGNTSNATLGVIATILDNDLPPTITINPNSGIEGINIANTTVNLSNPYSEPIEIHFSATPGSASAADYFDSTIPASIIISPGQTWTYFDIYVVDDAITEPDESFTLTAAVTSGNVANPLISVPILVVDNDTFPTVRIDNYTTTEGDSVYAYASLDRIYNTDVVVHFVTTTGTAGTDDYTSLSTDRTFFAGQSGCEVIQIATTDDALDEPYENFTLSGTVTSGNTVNPSLEATITIKDNDGLPDFEITQPEPLEEGSDAYFYLLLSAPTDTDTVIQVTTTEGTAGNLDYTPISTTVTIPAGLANSFDPVIVPTIFYGLLETNETFTITATVISGNTFNTSDSVTVTLLDDYNVHAHYDRITTVAETAATLALLTNDTLHGLPVNASDVIIGLGENNFGITVDSQGILTIPAGAPIGTYNLNYTLCEVANPSICSTVNIFIEVQSPLKITYSLAYADTNGDGYTSAGDVISYVIAFKNIGNAPISNITVDSIFSNSPTGFSLFGDSIANLNAGETNDTTFYSTDILTQEDINLGSYIPIELYMLFKGTYYGYSINDVAEYVETTPLTFSDGIKLLAFIDSNANGVQDETEINFPLGHFNYEINSNGIISNAYTTPYFLYESNPTTTYNLSYVIDPQYAGNYTCATSYPSVTVAIGTGITTYNFPIIATTPYEDLSISLVGYNPPRPGFQFNNEIIYTNNSTQTIASGTVTFTNDSAVSVIGEAGTVHTYTFTDLLPFESRRINIEMQTPTIPTVALGQLVTNTASISITANEINLTNNTFEIVQPIVGSWDPNDKTESHGGQILHAGFTADDYLTYTIRFENTGTASAINIKVEDILDAKLEPSSIKMVDASANYSLERIGTRLIWTFAGIDLPPSVEDDPVTGHGYIVFQVKPKSGFALGDIIPNTADIYFDFNPAIVTNTCITEFVPFLGLNAFDSGTFEYYPNPTSGTVTFAMKNTTTIDTLEVIDVLGKTLISKTVHFSNAEIDFSSLKQGIYLVKLKANGQTKTVKISKK